MWRIVVVARAMTRAAFEIPLADLGLSTRALNALDRIDVITVDDLLRTHPRRLLRLPGVGHKTRREIGTATKLDAEGRDAVAVGTVPDSRAGAVGFFDEQTRLIGRLGPPAVKPPEKPPGDSAPATPQPGAAAAE